jgi:hypothetical protein
MSIAVVDRRAWRFAAALAMALAGAVCGAETSTVAGSESAAPSATLAQLGTIEPGMEMPGTELPAAQAYGQWKVVDAAGPASGRGMIGRTLSFTAEALGWTDSSGKVAPGCPDHVYHIALEAMQVKQAAPAFSPGWAKFRLPPGEVGPMHMWECGDAESIFGPAETGGSVFFPVGTDRLEMNWMDGAVLLLRKKDDRL